MVIGRVVDGSRTIFPPAITEVMEKGYTTYIPLVLLHIDFLQSPEASRYARIALGLASGAKSVDQLPDAGPGGARFKQEQQMNFEEWLDAWDNLIFLIRKYLPRRTYKRWLRHWRFVYTHPDRHKHWPQVLLYCIRVREAATQESIDPGTFQDLIYSKIEKEELYRIAHGESSGQYKSSLIVHPKQPSSSSTQRGQSFRDSDAASKVGAGNVATLATRSRTAGPASKPTENQSSHNPSVNIGGLTEKVSVTPSTSLADAPTPNHANSAPTYAPYADQPSTEHRHALPDPRRASTLLIPEAWESEIRDLGLQDDFGDVPVGLREGFRIGAKHPVYSTCIPPNHSSATKRPDVIEKHIQTELAAGRYIGPFSQLNLEHLIGPFQTAPLGLVEKSSAPGSFRIIQDFSFNPDPKTPSSLNSQINTDDFPCVWGFFEEVYQIIAEAPEGTMGATFDVDSAYRQIPVHPDDQPHIVFMWEDKFYIDTRVPFGAASSNGLFARCGDLIMILYTRRGFGIVVKWVDDFLFIQFPSHVPIPPFFPARFSEQAVYNYGRRLGWQWKPSKTHPFAPIFRYLGLEWNIPTRLVRIPCEKRTRYLKRTQDWIDSTQVTLKDTEILVGSLVHCTQVIPDGRPHLSGLIRFLTAFNAHGRHKLSTRPPSQAAKADAKWWLDRLAAPHEGLAITCPPPLPLRIHTDASTSFGLGAVIGQEFASWKLTPSTWRLDSRDIGWAEAIAVEMALLWIIRRGIRNSTVQIHCDNQGLCSNMVFIRMAAAAMSAGIRLKLVYIPTKENLADAPSRNVWPAGLTRALDIPPIPDYLSHLIC
ncbi:polyprotein like [Ceratobasidium sp. AG-Ba]|nr:polyprotein like [Ceratobasidium sp. AG-Ba]